MPICQNGKVWQEYIHFDKLLSKHSQGGSGKAGGEHNTQHTHPPHPQRGGIPLGRRAGAARGELVQRCLSALPAPRQRRGRCRVSAFAAAWARRKSSAFSFLTFKIGEKGLKRELGAHCWGQTRGSEEGKHQGPWARGLCPRLPQPHVWMSWCVALREGPQLQLRPHRTRTGSPPCWQLRQLRTTSTQVQFFKPNEDVLFEKKVA